LLLDECKFQVENNLLYAATIRPVTRGSNRATDPSTFSKICLVVMYNSKLQLLFLKKKYQLVASLTKNAFFNMLFFHRYSVLEKEKPKVFSK